MKLFRKRAEDRALSKGKVPPVMLSSVPGNVTPQTALEIADAYACVRVLADAAGSLPIHTFRKTDAGRVRTYTRTAELLECPAPATTQANLVSQMVAHLNLHGNVFLGKYKDSDGRIQQLGLLAPDRMAPELRAGVPIYTYTDTQGRRQVLGTEDVVHIKAMGTDGLVGLSPIRQARAALGLGKSLVDHASAFFSNDARPSGLLKTPGGQSVEGLEKVEAFWGADHQGTDKAHRIAVVSGDVSFEAIGMPADDVQFLGQRKLSATEIARIFRVPPHMIGAEAGNSMTYKNLETASIEFVTYSLRPWLILIEQALSNDRDLFAANQYAEFQITALLRADSATRAEFYAKALAPDTGWMTAAEVRELENLPPDPRFDRSPAIAGATNGSGDPARIAA